MVYTQIIIIINKKNNRDCHIQSAFKTCNDHIWNGIYKQVSHYFWDPVLCYNNYKPGLETRSFKRI